MTVTLWAVLGVVILIIFGLIMWFRDLLKLRKDYRGVTENLAVLKKTSEVFTTLSDTINLKKKELQEISDHLSTERIEIKEEIKNLETRREKIRTAIHDANLQELQKIIEGK
jgi:hypothetical protein